MANYWAGSDFVLVANMDDGALLTDSSPVGTNTLTNNNSVTQSVDAKQGDRSGSFAGPDFNQSLTITDANLSAGFPGKNGTSNLDFTICFWCKFAGDPWSNAVISKFLSGVGKTFMIDIEGTGEPYSWIGDGNNVHSVVGGGASLVSGRWYHFVSTYLNSTKARTFTVWDDTAGSLSHNFSDTTAINMGVSTQPITIGMQSTTQADFYGQIDEVAIANSVYDSTDTDAIRAGTFGSQPLTYKISGYLQDSAAKIIVLGESDWEVETTQDVTLGNYEITDLVSGTKSVLAVSPEGEVVGFGGVDPVEV